MIKNFMKCSRGNVSMMFAVTSFAVLGMVALATDGVGVSKAQTTLQTQVDAAVLAVSQAGEGLTKPEMQKLAHASMIENGYPATASPPKIKVDNEGYVTVLASSDYNVGLMGVFGKDKIGLEADATSMIGSKNPLELALVLDTTKSMEGTKLATLKVAANELITGLETTDSDNVKVSIVPFANYVNVDTLGMDNRNANWMNVPADYSDTVTYTTRITTADGYCQGIEPLGKWKDDDGVPYFDDTHCNDWVGGTYEDGPEETRTIDYTWNGCVGSRDSNLHLRDEFMGSRFPGLLNANCGDPIVPLTNEWSDLTDAINALSVSGHTYMPAGLMWGQRTLSKAEPYIEGSNDPKGEKVLILMTDGLNTMNLGSGGWHNGLNMMDPDDVLKAEQTNQDTAEICRVIKSAGTKLYTIAFEVSDTTTKQMLRLCASSAADYFDASNSAELIASFRTIARKLNMVRLID